MAVESATAMLMSLLDKVGARDVVAARARPEPEPAPGGLDQDALGWCSAAWGARKVESGRWKLDVEDEGALPQGAYVIAPAYGFAYRSQQREQGCEGS